MKNPQAVLNDSRPQLRVMAVDDNPAMVWMLAECLRSIGSVSEVTTATCGESALRLCEGSLFHAVVTDLEMPGMDGLELTRRLCALGRRVAVIAVSIHDHPTCARRALSAGAVAFISKQNLAEELPSHIERISKEVSS